MEETDTGLAAAIVAAGGTRYQLAIALGLRPQWTYQWKKVPDRYVRQVSRDLKVPLHVLRPDLYEAGE